MHSFVPQSRMQFNTLMHKANSIASKPCTLWFGGKLFERCFYVFVFFYTIDLRKVAKEEFDISSSYSLIDW